MLSRFQIPLSWGELLKRTFNETLADDVLNLAAQQAYYFFFALFPALLALISIASFFPIENLIGRARRRCSAASRPPTSSTSSPTSSSRSPKSNAGGLLTFAFLFTLWSSFERGGLDVQHAERRLRHHRGPAVVEGAADRRSA